MTGTQFKISAGLAGIAVLAAFGLGPSAPGRAEEAPPAAEGQMPEVIIKGGDRSGVRSEKPPLQIEMDMDEPAKPVLEVEEETLRRQPEALRNPRAGFSESLANDKAILPARIRLAKDPVRVFYPLREILAISPALSQEIGTGWEMVITDSEGHSFRKFTGKGLPPGSLPWNGRSDRGEIVAVGKTYSIVINYRDIRGQGRNYVGEPFSFDGVIHQESKGLVISLATGNLFEKKQPAAEKEDLSASGLDLVKEAADWIKRYYFTYPIQVSSLGSNDSAAGARAKAVAEKLAKLLLLPRPEIPTSTATVDPNSERLDIVVVNR